MSLQKCSNRNCRQHDSKDHSFALHIAQDCTTATLLLSCKGDQHLQLLANAAAVLLASSLGSRNWPHSPSSRASTALIRYEGASMFILRDCDVYLSMCGDEFSVALNSAAKVCFKVDNMTCQC